MHFIGNDLVAFSELHYFDRPGYKNKAFTQAEIDRASLFNKDNYFGIIWSCKESAYKVFIKSGFRKAFSAGMFEAVLQPGKKENNYTGIVKYQETIFYTISEIKKAEYIHTLCSDTPEGLETVVHAARQIQFDNYDFQNNAVIELLKEYLGSNFQISPAEIDIHFDHFKKYPVANFTSGDKYLDISLSHDGHYVAFALTMNNEPS